MKKITIPATPSWRMADLLPEVQHEVRSHRLPTATEVEVHLAKVIGEKTAGLGVRRHEVTAEVNRLIAEGRVATAAATKANSFVEDLPPVTYRHTPAELVNLTHHGTYADLNRMMTGIRHRLEDASRRVCGDKHRWVTNLDRLLDLRGHLVSNLEVIPGAKTSETAANLNRRAEKWLRNLGNSRQVNIQTYVCTDRLRSRRELRRCVTRARSADNAPEGAEIRYDEDLKMFRITAWREVACTERRATNARDLRSVVVDVDLKHLASADVDRLRPTIVQALELMTIGGLMIPFGGVVYTEHGLQVTYVVDYPLEPTSYGRVKRLLRDAVDKITGGLVDYRGMSGRAALKRMPFAAQYTGRLPAVDETFTAYVTSVAATGAVLSTSVMTRLSLEYARRRHRTKVEAFSVLSKAAARRMNAVGRAALSVPTDLEGPTGIDHTKLGRGGEPSLKALRHVAEVDDDPLTTCLDDHADATRLDDLTAALRANGLALEVGDLTEVVSARELIARWRALPVRPWVTAMGKRANFSSPFRADVKPSMREHVHSETGHHYVTDYAEEATPGCTYLNLYVDQLIERLTERPRAWVLRLMAALLGVRLDTEVLVRTSVADRCAETLRVIDLLTDDAIGRRWPGFRRIARAAVTVVAEVMDREDPNTGQSFRGNADAAQALVCKDAWLVAAVTDHLTAEALTTGAEVPAEATIRAALMVLERVGVLIRIADPRDVTIKLTMHEDHQIPTVYALPSLRGREHVVYTNLTAVAQLMADERIAPSRLTARRLMTVDVGFVNATHERQETWRRVHPGGIRPEGLTAATIALGDKATEVNRAVDRYVATLKGIARVMTRHLGREVRVHRWHDWLTRTKVVTWVGRRLDALYAAVGDLTDAEVRREEREIMAEATELDVIAGVATGLVVDGTPLAKLMGKLMATDDVREASDGWLARALWLAASDEAGGNKLAAIAHRGLWTTVRLAVNETLPFDWSSVKVA